MRLLRVMLPPRWSRPLSAFVCLLAVACGDSGAGGPTEQSDSAVSVGPTTPLADAGVPVADAGPPAQPPLDGSIVPMDASQIPGADAACASDATPYACTCAADPTRCTHPLQGQYAVRTVSYARQKTTAAGTEVDLVSKGVLLSVADISAAGAVKEHLCFIELVNPDGLYSWILPSGTERIADSMATLQEVDGQFVRALAADRTSVSWSAANQPADCAPGSTHSSGCSCFAADTLPSDPKDCRVTDLDQDGAPGLKLVVSPERPLDPATGAALFAVQIAGVKAVEWRLPEAPAAKLVGKVEGSVEQNQLSVEGELAGQIGKVRSATCASDSAHVELVRGQFDCTKLLAGRAADLDGYGIFDPGLDGVRPETTACPDPDCVLDSDRDKAPDCQDACPSDPGKTATGSCGCGIADTNLDGDAQPDCSDACPNDASKTALGQCGCGMLELDSDADGNADCVDACASDPAKTTPGVCGCGVAETNTDLDALPDCMDGCAADPAKTSAGKCGCGVPDVDADADGTQACSETCDNDPLKTAPGQCGCGVADADLNADGTIDCLDLCPDDAAKTAPGACGCGVADSNTDGDAQPDCMDGCPADPGKLVPGSCGCGVAETVCNSPLLGSYAVRSVLHARQRIGSDAPTTSRAINYALVTIRNGAGGALTLSEQGCWVQTIPNPGEGGLAVYSWSKPSWQQALPSGLRTATRNADGSWSAPSASAAFGWDPARQPASCSASSTPAAGWPSAWGATCACHEPATSLPPYDRNTSPHDCRLTDPDADGYPGLSAYVSTSPPSAPDQDATGLLSARAFAVNSGSSRWTITEGANGRHTGTMADATTSVVVGCTGTACAGLGDVSPTVAVCPERLNTMQFVPVAPGYDSCAGMLAQRSTLFSTASDASWAEAAACPSP